MQDVPSSHFSTDGFEEDRRYEAFRESIGVIFEVSRPDDQGEGFFACLDSYLIKDLMLVRCQTTGQQFQRTSQMIAKDGIDHILIQTFNAGGTWQTNGRGNAHGKQGNIIILDASRSWKAQNSAFDNLTLIVPRRLLAPKLVHENDHHGKIIDANNPFGHILLTYMQSLQISLPAMKTREAVQLVHPSVDIVAAALNHRLKPDERLSTAGNAAQVHSLKVQIKQFIDAHLHDPDLNINYLTEAFHTSRAQLYRVFDTEDGIISYIRDRRLDIACKRIMFQHGYSLSISSIARSVGYRSEAAFSRAFKQRFKMAPRSARQHQIENVLLTNESIRNQDRIWEDWFRSL